MKLVYLYLKVGKQSLPEEEEKELDQVMSEMGNIYGTTTVCLNGTEWSNVTDHSNKCLPLSPDLNNIMATSNDSKLRSYIWQVIFQCNTQFCSLFC